MAFLEGTFALLISATIILSVFWIWMLIECINNKEIKGAEKALFLCLIIFLHWIGGAIYCFSVNRKDRLGCFPIMVIITASFIGLFFIVGLTKSINENKDPTIIHARKIINNFVDKINGYEGQESQQQPIKPKTVSSVDDDSDTNNWWHQYEKPRPYKPLNQSATDKALKDPRDELKQNKYILLNKSDKNRKPAIAPHEIANINTAKYSEKISSWIDNEGNVHFSNAGLQPGTK